MHSSPCYRSRWGHVESPKNRSRLPPDEATPQGDNSPSFLQFQFFDLTRFRQCRHWPVPRACGGRQPCAVMQSLALGPQVAFLEAADPAANRQGVSQIQASRGYQSSMRRVLQLSTAVGGHFEAPFISEIAAGRQRAITGHLENYGIFGAAPTSSHPDVGAKALVGETLPRLCSARATV